MGEFLLNIDCYIFPLGGVDIILRVAWLQTLGEVTANWGTLQMSFYHQNKQITLSDSPEMMQAQNFAPRVHKLTAVDYCVLLWDCFVPETTGQRENEISADQQQHMDNLLQCCTKLFRESSVLPPHRPTNHVILLHPRTSIVNVRPYRYGHHQKDEIEKLVENMLATRIIRHSSNPFSSLVLLVRKKDGNWRF